MVFTAIRLGVNVSRQIREKMVYDKNVLWGMGPRTHLQQSCRGEMSLSYIIISTVTVLNWTESSLTLEYALLRNHHLSLFTSCARVIDAIYFYLILGLLNWWLYSFCALFMFAVFFLSPQLYQIVFFTRKFFVWKIKN